MANTTGRYQGEASAHSYSADLMQTLAFTTDTAAITTLTVTTSTFTTLTVTTLTVTTLLSAAGYTFYPAIATGTVVAKAASDDLDATDFGKILTNTGAGGSITLTLLLTGLTSGQGFRVAVTAAQTVVLDPGVGKIYLNGSGVADKTLTIAGVIGNYADVFTDGTDYYITQYSGVLTKEA